VLGRLERAIDELQAGNVAVERLVERNRVSKPLEGYSQNTQNVAALKRARAQDLAVHPGQDIEYVVVDDEKSSRDRVALAHEVIEDLRRLVLRDATGQSCRERAVATWVGSYGHSTEDRGDTGGGVDGVHSGPERLNEVRCHLR